MGIFCPPRPAPITAVADEPPGPAEMLLNRTRGNYSAYNPNFHQTPPPPVWFNNGPKSLFPER